MNKQIEDALRAALRGRRASALLRSFGIDPKRYWLLMDLFRDLSDRGEMMDQLGLNGVALSFIWKMYLVVSALMAALVALARPPATAYLVIFLSYTAFLFVLTFLSEAANSLINPAEALVLAHQPINGATYTAAKLSHLGRIVLYVVPALNLIPAFVGLLMPRAGWFYPVLHLAAAFAAGIVCALMTCALFGWLLRFVPVRRLRGAGQLAAFAPVIIIFGGQAGKGLAKLNIAQWLPAGPSTRWAIAALCGAALTATVAQGLRALSADYLVRVSAILHGSAHRPMKSPGRSWGAAITRRLFGAQPGVAGYIFLARMLARDWQLRRGLAPMLFIPLSLVPPLLAANWRTDPFSRGFAPFHLLPHLLGALLFMLCTVLPYGNDYKGAWIFLLVSPHAIDGLASGVYALLWIWAIAVPHVIGLLLLPWIWGIWHAVIFVAYSAAVSSLYLALELRLIEAAPCTKPMDPAHGPVLMGTMMVGAIAMAVAVGLQYFIVFSLPAVAAAISVLVAIAAWFATRASLNAFAASIRYQLSLTSAGIGALYREV